MKFLEIVYEEGSNVKSKTTALILAIILPGVDRIYLGKVVSGVLKLITGGGLGIWWIIDIISIATGKATDSDGNTLQ
jgi:TM2 domain-containing membrane protein YozV